nr:secreted protein [Achlya hypogyna]
MAPPASWLHRLERLVITLLPNWFVAPFGGHYQSRVVAPPPDVVATTTWTLRLGERVTLLATATPSQASRRSMIPLAVQLPTSHLGLPDDFYSNPDHTDVVVALRLPDNVLPKFADFVYRVVIRAIPLRSRLHYLGDQTCVLCTMEARETYLHFLIDCPFVQSVWAVYEAALADVGFKCPTSLQNFIFKTPHLRRPWQRAAFDSLWPILRACIWFTIWKRRNDAVFRPHIRLDSPTAVAAKAAFAIQVHVQHLLANDPDNPLLIRLLLALRRNDWARTHLTPPRHIQATTT